MFRAFVISLLFAAIASVAALAQGQSFEATAQSGSIPFGDNRDSGAFAKVNGISLYYEEYGSGPPVLVLHGNDQSIEAMSSQISALSQHFRVIAVDSRGHGKSGMGKGVLTYVQMAEDCSQLLDELNLNSAYVLGWSDGGIVGLLLAIKHPAKVVKLAVFGASLNPPGAHDWAFAWVNRENKKIDSMIKSGDTSRSWKQYQQILNLLLTQPDIRPSDLKTISAPTLVMAGDKDIIRTEHTVQIFEGIPNAQLAIFPGATHFMPTQSPNLVNTTVLSFFQGAFKRPDSKTYLQ